MNSFAEPVQIAALSAAVLWPLAAGATLVLWTKARAAERRRRLAVIDGGLQGLFHTMARQPVPDRLEMVVETLEDREILTPKAGEAAAPRRRKTAPAS